jgi:translation initiation factor eIF-2B subunit epsilon
MSNQAKKKPAQNKVENIPEDKLIALILLDSYTHQFEPFSSTRAECLMPFVGGRCLLDNNIEYLIENQVEEIYLFCTKHHHQIKEHIEEKKWRERVEIHFLYNFKCQSLGDAMREIDAKGLIRSNFILMTASSIISNISLKEHLELHKQVSKTDKNAIMTMLCMSRLTDLSYSSSLKDSGINDYNNTLILHGSNGKILHYEQFAPSLIKKKEKNIKIPCKLLEEAYKANKQTPVDNANAKYMLQSGRNSSLNAKNGFQGGSPGQILHLKTVQQRNDLLESQIYLCHPYVLNSFTDNFDFENMNDFIKGVLVDEEVSGYTMYIDVFKMKFGSHFSLINNLNSYYYEFMRLLSRSDLILDANTKTSYKRLLDKVNVYLSKKSEKFGNNIKMERNVFIESNCKIGNFILKNTKSEKVLNGIKRGVTFKKLKDIRGVYFF